MKQSKKVVLVGAGAVGTSFLYSALNQGLAQNYVLIDAFPNAAEGNAMDLGDAEVVLPERINDIKAGDYSDCKDADVIVITAGRPQKDGETRLDMVVDNAKIMKQIATNIKDSGFKGVTIIASNPVDVLTFVYQKVTGFDERKVISSGTTLDSARLRKFLAKKLEISAKDVNVFLMGEHGDSSVAAWSHAVVMGQPLQKFIDAGRVTMDECKKMEVEAINYAYKIIEKKRATFYGIGACLAAIAKAVLRNERSTYMVGAPLHGEYNNDGVYAGVPVVLGENGIEEIIEYTLNKEEQAQFDKSCAQLRDVINVAHDAIK